MHTIVGRGAAALLVAASLACGGPSTPDAKSAKSDPKAKADTKPAGGKDAKVDDDGAAADDGGEDVAQAAWAWTLPKGINVPPRVPDDNPMSQAKVELGHRLFMDKRLSVDGTRSCYSCHQNELGNADGRAKALGPGNKDLPRNTPTIWNVGLATTWYWDGRSDTLEAQGLAALKGGNMGLGDAVETKAAEIGALPEYADAFAKAFGLGKDAKITGMHVAQALSAYERTLLCGGTAHDDEKQSEAAKRGFALFAGPAGCITCHAGDNFSDGLYHRMGIGAGDPATEGIDLGRGKVSGKAEENFMFRTPTLRNVAKTAPYFHDGSVATLEDAVKIMASGGITTAGPVDANLIDRKLTPEQLADLVAFLQSLDCPGELEVIGDQKVDGIGK
jgi:cytochrome c peroxidase